MHLLENRIPPPLVALIFALLMWSLAYMTPVVMLSITTRVVAAAVFAGLGAFYCLAGVISFRRAKTTVNPLRPDTASSLVCSGIYQYTRNPMYVGFALGLVALAHYLASPAALLGVAGFVLYINRFQIAPEERALTQLFKQDFDHYRSRVRRWL